MLYYEQFCIYGDGFGTLGGQVWKGKQYSYRTKTTSEIDVLASNPIWVCDSVDACCGVIIGQLASHCSHQNGKLFDTSGSLLLIYGGVCFSVLEVSVSLVMGG